MSQVMFILRGPIANGKSTVAKKWVAEKPYDRIRVNRDDLRHQMHNEYVLPHEMENFVSKMEAAMIETAFKNGKSVVVDNQNVKAKWVKEYLMLAKKYGVPVIHKDVLVDMDEAIKRNAARDRVVPETEIVKAYKKYVQSGKLAPFPVLEDKIVDTYVADVSKPKAYIVDLDGTVADLGARGPFEWDKVLNDNPITPVIEVVRLLHASGAKILITSGRDSICRSDTLLWLNVHEVPYDELFMRPEGSYEKDFVVKKRIFDENIRENYNVVGAFDDRLQVCELWYELGVPLFRVGNPNAFF